MTATAHMLTPDTQAILLLSGSLGQTRGHDVKPLSPTEYHELARLLHSHQLRPADLLELDGLTLIRNIEPIGFDDDRIAKLLSRGAALALAIETWTNRGLWVLSRSDSQYPQRLRSRLGKSAPPVIYGIGSQELLSAGGLAIIGSREIDDEAVAFTRAIAARCAHENIAVISGGARGVDSEAMLTSLEAGGFAVGVLAESLLKASVSGKYRAAVRAGHLALISTYDPDVGFSVGNAMGRNKYIYALCDYALVVNAALEHGGTWSGAIENLSRHWVPLFVRANQPLSPGNRRLIEQGSIALPDANIAPEQLLTTWMRMQSEPVAETQPALKKQTQVAQDDQTASDAVPTNDQHDLFQVVWPYLEQELRTERTDRELAECFGIELAQIRAWLQRAVDRHMVKKLSKPVRYIAAPHLMQSETLSLFS